ncbi:hypothetical protein ABZP36_001098 [Zizania latifolia]
MLFLLWFAVVAAALAPAAASGSGELFADFYSETCPQALPTIKLVVGAAILKEPRMGASLVRLHFHDCFVNGCDGSILLDDTDGMIGEKTAQPNNMSVRGFDVVTPCRRAACLRVPAVPRVCAARACAAAASARTTPRSRPTTELCAAPRSDRTARQHMASGQAHSPIAGQGRDVVRALGERWLRLRTRGRRTRAGTRRQAARRHGVTEVLLGRRDATTASIDDANDGIPNPFMDFPELI